MERGGLRLSLFLFDVAHIFFINNSVNNGAKKGKEMGRPRKYAEALKITEVRVTARITEEMLDEIDRVGIGRFKSRNDLLIRLLRLGLEAEKRALAAHDSPIAQTTR